VPFDEARPTHMSERVQFQQIDALAYTRHHFHGGARIIFGNPGKNAVQILFRSFADGDFHTP
jgi:hypothetical protein